MVGVLYRRDLEPFLEDSAAAAPVGELVHAPLYVPVGARLGGAQAHADAKTPRFCSGWVAGRGIAMEDLLEEIVSDINDEFDEEVRAQTRARMIICWTVCWRSVTRTES
jgi:Mg2+/Co2+ transporter CorC